MIIALHFEVLWLIGFHQLAWGALCTNSILRCSSGDLDTELLSEIDGFVDILGATTLTGQCCLLDFQGGSAWNVQMDEGIEPTSELLELFSVRLSFWKVSQNESLLGLSTDSKNFGSNLFLSHFFKKLIVEHSFDIKIKWMIIITSCLARIFLDFSIDIVDWNYRNANINCKPIHDLLRERIWCTQEAYSWSNWPSSDKAFILILKNSSQHLLFK